MSRRGRSVISPHGLLYVDKPAGPTSAEIVDWVRWCFEGAPVGHFGTLDPAATGLLVLGVGRATRLNTYASAQDKTYDAAFVLGRSTTTADADGDTVDERPVTAREVEVAGSELRGLVGEWMLPPPAYSAIKIDGVRAHTLARAERPPDMPERPMAVRAVEQPWVDVSRGSVGGTLSVSKGTYVRSLAEELGRRVGCPAHLGTLRRTRSGTISLRDPHVVAGFDVTPLPPSREGKPRHRIRWREGEGERPSQRTALEAALQPLHHALSMPVCRASEGPEGAALIARVAQGRAVDPRDPGWNVPAESLQVALLPGRGDGLVILDRDPDPGSPFRVERTILAFADQRE